jgi:tetrapyrrole methylase family protein / MazG family protein
MKKTGFVELKEVFRTLRGPEGCPWDKEQTHESMIKGLKEETRELIDAIKSGQQDHIKEELGDVLLQVMFHAQISSDEGDFDIEDVIDGLIKKLKRRHPHIFGTKKVISSSQVLLNWNRIKAEEKKKKHTRKK